MRKALWLVAALCLNMTLSFGDVLKYEVHGQAWNDFGRIMKATDSLLPGGVPTLALNLNGNPIVNMGGQFTIEASFSEHWEGAFGFGAHKVSHALGHGQKSFLAISMFHTYISESRLTWFRGEKESPALSVTVGSFPYKYNSNTRNLGLYLFRGPVYPGILMGGFQDFAVDSTKSTQLGAKFRHAMGNFSHDIILNSERDIPPTFDWSLGYVAKYKAFNALEFGAGINLYRLFAYDKRLQVPGKMSDEQLGFQKAKYIEVGADNDTTFFTHQGTKVMGMVSLDLKPLFGIGSMGGDDLKIYSEGAILGLKNQGTVYGNIYHRIPLMFGFNLPTFGLLDHLSMEVEYYKSPYRNDLSNLGNNNLVADWTIQSRPVPSPKPVHNSDYGIDSLGNWTDGNGQPISFLGTGLARENISTDDWKWSVNIDKIIAGKIRLMAQVANDHYRPRPVASGLIAASGGMSEAFSESSNWYFMTRIGYFF